MAVTTDIMAEDFQLVVEKCLKRNRSLLDTLSKFEVACARMNRAVIKASTQCGCVVISGEKQSSQPVISGELCKHCREAVQKEMGDMLFFSAAIANALDISLYDVMLGEKQTLTLLGDFSLK